MKKHQWELPCFTLSLEHLWENGPQWSEGLVAQVREADKNLKAKFSGGNVGFYDWPHHCPAADVTRMQEVGARLRRDFEGVLCIGIGGSYLGPEALLQSLRRPEEKESFPIHWLSNVDPSAVAEAEHFCKKRRVATVVISKSGGTTETLAGFFHLSPSLPKEGFVVITDPKGGELRRLAERYRWESFPVPPNIGGRFSVLSAVGLFPAALASLRIDSLLKGAARMRETLEASTPETNPAYQFAAAKFLWDTQFGHSVQYLMPYASQLKYVGDWYVQLWAESLGKKQLRGGKAVGFTPVSALGTSDQHSVLQLLKEGPNTKVVGFIDVQDSSEKRVIGKPAFETDAAFQFLFPHTFSEVAAKASFATEKSLRNSAVPTYRITLPRVDAEAMGALFFFMETACAFAGELYEVDAFNQPGVEESKKLLRESL